MNGNKVVVIWGPHASGKTTFVKQFVEKHQFNGYVFHDGAKGLSGNKQEKIQNLEAILKDLHRDAIFEGHKLPISLIEPFCAWTQEFNYELLIILVVCSPQRFVSNLKHRKLSKGKEWTEKEANWENKFDAGLRHLNHCTKVFENISNKNKITFLTYRLPEHNLNFFVYKEIEECMIRFLNA